MARHIFQGIFTDGNGRIVSATTTADGNAGLISIYLAGTTTPANVYEAASGGSHVQSVYTDDDGKFAFYVDDSEYTPNQKFKIILSHANFQSKTYDNLKIIPDEAYYYYVDPSVSDQGAATARGNRSLYDLVTSIGASKRATIIFAHSNASSTTTYTFLTSLNLDSYSNITIKIENGAILSPASGKTLTISNLEAGLYQVFDGDGTVAGGPKISAAYPEWFGAIGDGTIDDTVACQKALDFFNYVVFSAGKTYLINAERVTYVNPGNNMVAGILCNNNQHIYCQKNSRFAMKTAAHNTYAIIGVYKVSNVTIYNANLTGDRSTHVDDLTANNGYGIYVQDSSQVNIVECYAEDFWGDGFNIDASDPTDSNTMSDNINLIDCISTNNRRQGLSVTGGKNITIRGGEYKNSNGTDPQAGIDFEPNDPATININCLVDGVKFTDNVNFGIMVTYCHNLQIANCYFSGNSLGHIYTTRQHEVYCNNCRFENGNVVRFAQSTTHERIIHISNSYMEISGSYTPLVWVGTPPFFDGYVSVINSMIRYTTSGNTIDLNTSSDQTKKCVFTNNTIEVQAGFDPSNLVSGNILLYIDGNNAQWIVDNNRFINLSTNTLHINGGTSSYTLFRANNILIGDIDDADVLGQPIRNIAFGAIAAGAQVRVDVGITGAEIGDRVNIYPQFAADYVIFQAFVISSGIVRCIATNPSGASQDPTGDFLIEITKS